MKPKPAHVLVLLALPSFIGLGACLGNSPPSNFYVLTALPPEGAAPRDVVVRIARVELPRYLATPEIVTRRTESHLEHATFELWAEPLEDGFARTLRSNLAELIPSDQVVFDVLEAAKPDHHVMVYVDRFDVDAGGTARLEARWGLTGSDHEAGVDLHYTRLEQAVEGEGYDAIAAALSATVADLAREIAGAIRQAHGG